ncbi:MAG TPA: hypothetical protein VGO57_01270 [Verrucomicrobiae bacterium]|jgi:hypothetical protein
MSERDQRILRYGSIAVAIYLILFFGRQFLEKQRTDYRKLVTQAQDLREQNQPYADRIALVKKMMDDYNLDPAKLRKASVVAEASAAIQNSARTGGVGLGPIRESATSGTSKQVATIQIEGSGSVASVLGFMSNLDRIGFPLVIDSAQITAGNNQPGQIKVALTIVILDFDQWKGTPHA